MHLYTSFLFTRFSIKITINHSVSEWTPIFNSTSNMVGPFTSSNLPVFKLKFTENKVADKYLYQGVNVNLYNGNGTKLGLTNFIIYAGIVDEEVQITAYKRFYFSGPWSETEVAQGFSTWTILKISTLRWLLQLDRRICSSSQHLAERHTVRVWETAAATLPGRTCC